MMKTGEKLSAVAVSREEVRNSREAHEILSAIAKSIDGYSEQTFAFDKELVLRIRLCVAFRDRLKNADQKLHVRDDSFRSVYDASRMDVGDPSHG